MSDFLNLSLWEQVANYHEGNPKLIQERSCTFSVYHMKINVLTYLKGRLEYPIQVVGIPLSVSEKGYSYSSSEGKAVLEKWLEKQKGLTVVLNADDDLKGRGIQTQTLPTLILPIAFTSFEDYKRKLRSHYRYRIQKAEERFRTIETREHIKINEQLYKLYERVYEKSPYKLEKVSYEYFRDFEAQIDGFYIGDRPIGFCQYKHIGDVMYFMFCGIDYDLLTSYDTYYNMLLHLINKAILSEAKRLNFGQTTEDIKGKLGGQVERRWMVVYHNNRIICGLLRLLKPFIGYKFQEKTYKVFKSTEKR